MRVRPLPTVAGTYRDSGSRSIEGWTLSPGSIGYDPLVTDADRLNAREHSQPHAYLGAHPDGDGAIVRAWRPAAASVTVVPGKGKPVAM